MGSEAGMPLTDEVMMMRAVSACVSAPREASEVDDSGVPPGGTRAALGSPGTPRAAVGPRGALWDLRSRAPTRGASCSSSPPLRFVPGKRVCNPCATIDCAPLRALCAYARQNARETFLTRFDGKTHARTSKRTRNFFDA